MFDCLTFNPERTALQRSGPASAAALTVRAERATARTADARTARRARGDGAAALREDDDILVALARSLPADVRRACVRRAEKRAFAQAGKPSDPCICGEALLFAAAAGLGSGRAPLSAYRALGEWR